MRGGWPPPPTEPSSSPPTDADLRSLVAAGKGDTKTLADDKDLRAVAEGLDDQSAYAAWLSGSPMAPSSRVPPLVRDRLGKASDGLSYRSYGIGAAYQGGQAKLVVVLVQADDGQAKANAGKLRKRVDQGSSAVTNQPWSELLHDGHIEAKAETVIATFTVARANLWLNIVLRQDSLIAVS